MIPASHARTPASPAQAFDALPLHLNDGRPPPTPLTAPLFGLVALMALVAPAGMIAVLAAGPSDLMPAGAPAPSPVTLAKAGLGIAILAAIFLLPLAGLIRRLAHRRAVVIEGGLVRIVDRGLALSRTRKAPLASYLGIVHLVRSSLSGTRHELVLAHDDPRLDVVLMRDAVITDDVVGQATMLLSRPRLAPAELLARRLGLQPSSADRIVAGASAAGHRLS